MKKVIALVAFATLLSGCARGHWDYGAMDRGDAMKMAYDCQFMANMQAKGHRYATGLIAEDQFRQCMQSRGFVWVSEEQRAAVYAAASYPENKGPNTGFVDVDAVIKNSKYIKDLWSSRQVPEDRKHEVALLEIKKASAAYCEKYGYEYLSIKGGSPEDRENGYLCPPKSPGAIAPNQGNATGDFTGFMSRQ